MNGLKVLETTKCEDSKMVSDYYKALREHLINLDKLLVEPKRATSFRSLNRAYNAEEIKMCCEETCMHVKEASERRTNTETYT